MGLSLISITSTVVWDVTCVVQKMGVNISEESVFSIFRELNLNFSINIFNPTS